MIPFPSHGLQVISPNIGCDRVYQRLVFRKQFQIITFEQQSWNWHNLLCMNSIIANPDDFEISVKCSTNSIPPTKSIS